MIELNGKVMLVVGVANQHSIAWAVAHALHRCGAKVILTYQNERLLKRVDECAKSVTPAMPCLELDATNAAQLEAVMAHIDKEYGRLDGLVHSIAFAPREDLNPGITRTPWANYALAIQISAYTLIDMARAAMPLFEKVGGGSIITMTYDTQRVYPNYNLMGIAKAALEQSMRYLAWDAGRKQVRVNAISAGPIKTLAARGISGFSDMLDAAAKKSPLGRTVTQEEVGGTAAFLLSPLASGITGQIIYVDAGQSIMGAEAKEAAAGE